MAKTVLAIGAHYDDCVFGVPGILLQAVRKHYRAVVLSLIGDYSNWSPVKGREKDFVDGTIRIGKEFGVEMRFLAYASHRYDVTLESKRAVAGVVAEVKPEIAFYMWPHDHHHDHEVASVLSKIALRHGDRVWEQGPVPSPRRLYAYDNGPRHTVGFLPNTFVDISADWPAAMDWLGQLMALVRNQPYDRKKPDGAVLAKEALARYRGQTCGVAFAEALWAPDAYTQDIL